MKLFSVVLLSLYPGRKKRGRVEELAKAMGVFVTFPL
jgi:hypothetical protein